MGWLKKNWFLLVVILVAIIGGYYFLKKNPSASTADSETALGKTLSGRAYYESDVQKKMKEIRGQSDWFAKIKEKATATKKTVEQQLRADAIYMLENVD